MLVADCSTAVVYCRMREECWSSDGSEADKYCMILSLDQTVKTLHNLQGAVEIRTFW